MTYGRCSGKSVNRMTPKTLVGSKKLGEKIRARWLELDLTIEEVALRAGIGTKTWRRYEAGGIHSDGQAKGICKALNWRDMADLSEEAGDPFLLQKRKEHETGPEFLKERFGTQAAETFAMGSWRYLDSRSFFQSRF